MDLMLLAGVSLVIGAGIGILSAIVFASNKESTCVKWHNTKTFLPPIDTDNMGWVLGRFSVTKFSTVRFVKENDTWQNWDYSWCKHAPKQWTPIPRNLILGWGTLYED